MTSESAPIARLPLRPLSPGAAIAVVAPAGPAPLERVERGLAALRAAGWSPNWSPTPPGPRHYLAGSDRDRAGSLFEARGADAIWALRGGYGTSRTLAELGSRLPELIASVGANRTPILGFSDLTPLLNYVAQAAGVPTLHAPVVTQFGEVAPAARDHVSNLLSGSEPPFPVGPATQLRSGEARGPLYGGNLSVLVSLIGTAWMPRLAGALLLLEDVGEPAYRIDRALTQLRQSGALDGVQGFLFGHFSGVAEGDRAGLRHLFEEFAGSVPGPSVIGLPIGHEPDNHAVALGALLDVSVGDRVTIRYTSEVFQ